MCNEREFRRRHVLAALLLGFAAPHAQAAEFCVGATGDAARTHATLIAAVLAGFSNGPGLDRIRIANNQSYSDVVLVVSGQSLRFEGGYTNCGAATAGSRTLITGSTGATPAFATSGGGDHVLELVNLEIANSPVGGSGSRLGGGLRVTGDYQVTLRNVRIRDNVAARGGGIYVDGSSGARLTLATPLNAVHGNIASISGGGIYCVGAAQITLAASAAAVYQNTAEAGGTDPNESGSGGGVSLFDGCALTQHGGPTTTGVFDNSAVQYGGGYFLRNAARLHLVGNNQHPARVIDNRSTLVTGGTPGAGGGLALVALTPNPALRPEVLAENAWIEDNYAWQGSGVALLGGGRFEMRRTLAGAACHDARYCSSLSLNGTDGPTLGVRAGALWAGDGTEVEISGTYIEGNSAQIGSAMWTNRSARVVLDSVVLSGNHGSSVLLRVDDVRDDGGFDLAWSTVHGNLYTGSSVSQRILDNDTAPPDSIRIFGSLLAEPRFIGVEASGLRSDCVLRDPAMTALGTGSNVTRQGTLASPYGMVAPASGNFHLSDGNVVPVDWCDTSLAPRRRGDIAGSLAVVDAQRPNLHGINDLGAHEFPIPGPVVDALFADGFE
jgi:hypothetical protein